MKCLRFGRTTKLQSISEKTKLSVKVSLYRVFQVKCNITKRHISASRADKMILKKVLESSMNTIFYVKNS